MNLLTKARNLMTQPLDVTITVEPTTPEEMLAVHVSLNTFFLLFIIYLLNISSSRQRRVDTHHTMK